MTTLAHFALSYLIADLAGAPGELSMALALRATYPDTAAYPDHLKAMRAAKARNEKGWWKARDYSRTYHYLHHEEPLMWAFAPEHLGLDRITHKKTGGWKKVAKVWEGMIWVACIVHFFGKWRIIP